MLKKFLIYVTVPLLCVILSMTPINLVKAQDDKVLQLETNLRLFDDALKEFGAPTPEETALIWAKGVATRNGAMQYSVFDEKLKAEFKRKMDGRIWVTGTSSPWIIGYTIIDNKKTGEDHLITLEFTWATSTGPAGKTKSRLTISKEDGKWRISKYEDVKKA